METTYNYMLITVSPASMTPIRTNQADLGTLDAIRIRNAINGSTAPVRPDSAETFGASIDRRPDHDTAFDSLTIPDTLPDGTKFYREPGHVLDITVLLEPTSQADTPDILDVTVPAFLVDKDCTGSAVRGLFREITKKAYEANLFPVTRNSPESVTYSDLFELPAAFLNRYGVTVELHRSYLFLKASVDDPVIANANQTDSRDAM